MTEAGPPPAGLIKATAGLATLLSEGIGDTIRYSLTADPVQEARAGRQLLEALGLRERTGLDLIACPSCGRAEVDVMPSPTPPRRPSRSCEVPIQVAVMGCVVNGPGEAREADLGIAAGRKRGHLFVKGKVVKVVRRGRDGRRARRVGQDRQRGRRRSRPGTSRRRRRRRRPRRTAPPC